MKSLLATIASFLMLAAASIAQAQPFVYATQPFNSSVAVIDTVTGSVVATVPVGNSPQHVAVNAAGTFVYVTNTSSNDVTVFNAATLAVVATVPVGNAPFGIAVSPASPRAYTANGNSNSVSVIDTSTNSVIATVAVGPAPNGLAVNPAGTRVYVPNRNANTVSVIDTSTNTVIAAVAVGSAPFAAVVNPAGTRVYVINRNGNTVSVIDTSNNTVIGGPIAVGSSPAGIAINSAGTRVYVSNSAGDSVSVIETTGNTVLATVPVGLTPFIGVALNAAGTFAYVSSSGSNAISVINTATNTVSTTIPITGQVYGLAVNPTNNPMVPGTPAIGTAVAGNGSATVNYTPAASNGGSIVFTYTATSSPGGIQGSATGGPIIVSGLTNGTAYTFTVTATNTIGVSRPSIPSNSVTPSVPPSICQFIPTTGAWNVPGNWANCSGGNGVPAGTPGTNDRAEITGKTATFPAGTFNVGDLYLGAATLQGAGLASTTLNVVNAGGIAWASGSYTFQDMTIVFTSTSPIPAANGPMTINNAVLTLATPSTVMDADSILITGVGAKIVNGGIFHPSSSLSMTLGGAFENTAVGFFYPLASITVNGTFLNRGAFLMDAGVVVTLSLPAQFLQSDPTAFITGDGTISAVGQTLTIANGFIEGNVTFNVATLNNTGAIVSPGGFGVIGTVTVNGNYTVSGAGRLEIDIAAGMPLPAFDELNVVGTSTITGSNVDFYYIDIGFGTYVPTIGDILTFHTAGTVAGVFAGFSTPMSANVVSLSHSANDVQFVVTPPAPAITVTGTTTFPNTVVASLSGVQPITITNSGTGTLTLSLITASNVNLFFDTTSGPAPNAAHWCGFGSAAGGAPNTGAPISIAPGGTCVINAVFAPNAVGGLSSSIIITSNAPTSPTTITLNGTGLAAAGPTMTVAFAPTSVAPGVNSTMTLTLTTPDASPAFISGGSITIPAGLVATPPGSNSCGTFGSVSAGVYSFGMGFIPAMGSCTIALTVQSPTPGTYTANIAAGALSAGAGMNTNTSTATLTVAVPAPVITSATTASGTVGTAFTYNTIATNTPTSFTATGLPAGLTINTTNGVISGTPTAAGTSSVALSATNAGGTGPATLTITVTAAPAPAVTLTPPTVAFGSRTVSTTSAPTVVTLGNSGTALLTITSITATGNFAVTSSCPIGPATLAVLLGCPISITFTPLSAGALTGSISIVSNAPGSPHTIALTGTGIALLPQTVSFAVAPASITVGGTSVGTLTITNPNASPLTANPVVFNYLPGLVNAPIPNASSTCPGAAPVAVPGAGSYSQSTSFTLPAAGSCTFSATITSATAAVYSGNIAAGLIVTPAGSSNATPFNLTVTAAPAPAVTLTPPTINFGARTVNTTSPPTAVTLSNSGTANLVISSITGSGDFGFTSTCPLLTPPLAPAGICAINVTFTPLTAAALTGSISIVSNAPGSPHSIGLSGTGSGVAVPGISIAPAALTFSAQIINTTSAVQSVIVTNTGFANLLFSGIGVGAPFNRVSLPAATPANCGVSLAPGSSCQIGVTFNPAGLGVQTALISIIDNAVGSPHTASLSGTGVPVSVAIISAGSSVAFGDQIINTTSGTQTISIGNTGTAPLTVSAITLTGTNAANFTLSGQGGCTGASIAPAGSCTLTISFTPTTTGAKTAQINLTSNAQNAAAVNTIALTGNGILAPRAIVNLTSTAIGFGNVIFGGATPSQVVTLTNSGGQALSITSLAVTGDFIQSNNCGASVASLASCTINILFTPLGQGARAGELLLSTNAATSPDRIQLSGTGCRWFSQAQSRFFLTSC